MSPTRSLDFRLTPEQEALVVEHLPLVHSLAGRLKWGDYDDRVQDGCLGLIRGVRRFDSSLGFKGSTYLGHCIWGQIIDSARLREGTRQKHKRGVEFVSLQKPIHISKDNTDVVELGDTIADEAPLPDEAAEQAELEQVVNEVVASFREDQQRFIRVMATEKGDGAKSALSRELGCSEANVTCRIRVLRKHLQRRLEERGAA